MADVISNGAELIESLTRFGPHHPRMPECPHCGKNVSREGLVRLLYAFARCTCDRETVPHLIEQVWHQECFRAR